MEKICIDVVVEKRIDRRRANGLRMKEERVGIFAPAILEKAQSLGGRACKQKRKGIFAPDFDLAAAGRAGAKASGLADKWNDPVYRERMRWRKSGRPRKKS